MVINSFCRILYAIRFWHCLLAMEHRFGWRRQLIVLLYHRIRDDHSSTPLLSQVEEGVLQSVLDRQLGELCRWYTPVASGRATAILTGEVEPRHDEMLVTFDDGYQDNRTLAGPVLRRHRVPAMLFIATGFVDSSARFWWVRLNDILRRFPGDAAHRAAEATNEWPRIADLFRNSSIASDQQRRELRARTAVELEKISDIEKQAVLDQLGSVVDDDLNTSMPLLSWDDICAMENEGFEFGAHTVNHPQLTRLTPEQQRVEIVASVDALQQRIGRRPQTFAYPYGNYNDTTIEQVRQADLDVAYAANPGLVVPGSTSAHRVPRIQLYLSEPSKLIIAVVTFKLAKYLPRIARPLLSRLVDEAFEV